MGSGSNRLVTSDHMNRVTPHKAGHVTVALYLGQSVSKIRAIPDDISEGGVTTPNIESWPLASIASLLNMLSVADTIAYPL